MADKLEFIDGEENRLIIEAESKMGESIFRKQYSRANDIYDKIKTLTDKSIVDNNIIAFCGDRGTGKTSCMETFRCKIMNSDHETAVLPTIDPSFFDDNHNILQLILGQIYKSVQEAYISDESARNNYLEFNYSEPVLTELNKAISYLKYLSKSGRDLTHYDGMEELEYLAAGIHLRDSISNVIKEYLRFKNKKRLIISIDDLDLNIQGAYIMAEHIRKYLSINSCVILLSVNVDQLIDVIKVQLEEHKAIKTESYNMAVKYITKFIPIGNRVNLPLFENYCDTKLDYIIGDNRIIFNSVKEAITKLIYLKTGYLFYNSRGKNSLIIPRNLRSLRQLLHLLVPLKDYNKDLSLEELRGNQLIFKNYFFGTWTKQFNEEYRSRVDKIIQNPNTISINKTIVSQLVSAVNISNISEISDICNPFAYTYNISLGDVMRIVEILSQDESDNQLKLFLFFIRSYLSMCLYEAYDDITEICDHSSLLEGERVENENKNDAEIYATDALLDSINQLQRIVNGQYFSYSPSDFLAPKQGFRHRDKRLINGDLLFNELTRITRLDNINETDKIKFRTLEFFILCISRGVSLKNPDGNWAKQRGTFMPVHLTLNRAKRYLVFDVLSPFFNVLNLKTTYSRFDRDSSCSLFTFANSRDWTLLRRLLGENEHVFLSDAVIRNTEVLTAMGEKLKTLRTQSRVKQDHLHIADFYKDIINSEMKTYADSSGIPHTINFKFLCELQKVLNDCKEEYFDSIFNLPGNLDIDVVLSPQDIFVKDTYRRSTIIRNLKAYFPSTYKKIAPKEWKELFPAGKDLSQKDIISKIIDIMNRN